MESALYAFLPDSPSVASDLDAFFDAAQIISLPIASVAVSAAPAYPAAAAPAAELQAAAPAAAMVTSTGQRGCGRCEGLGRGGGCCERLEHRG